MSGDLTPGSERDVVDAVHEAARRGMRVRICGGSLSARPPGPQSVAIRTTKMAGIVEHRPGDLIATARAGTRLVDLDAALRLHGQRLPLSPFDRDGVGTVGGAFAAAADGLRARLGFRCRDVLVGATAVLGNGDVVTVGARVLKSVAGFDVCKALVGSRGTLAAITSVSFRVETVPEAATVVTGRFDAPDELLGAVRAADSSPLAPHVLVVDDDQVVALFEGPPRAVDAAVSRVGDVGLHPFGDAENRLQSLTAAWSTDPANGVRLTGDARRTDPLDARPDGAVRHMGDILRRRFVAHVPRVQETPGPAPSSLFLTVQRAFDPDGRFEPGRGFGAR